MGLGKTLTMLTAVASSKKAAERHCEMYIQGQRQLAPTKGTLVVVTSRRKLSGPSCLWYDTNVQVCDRGFGSLEE